MIHWIILFISVRINDRDDRNAEYV